MAAEVSSFHLVQPQFLSCRTVLFPLLLSLLFLPFQPCLYFFSQSLGFPLCLPFGFSYFSGWMLQLGRTQSLPSSCFGLQLHPRLCFKNADFPLDDHPQFGLQSLQWVQPLGITSSCQLGLGVSGRVISHQTSTAGAEKLCMKLVLLVGMGWSSLVSQQREGSSHTGMAGEFPNCRWDISP